MPTEAMSIKSIFMEAMDIPHPVDRAAFLDRACAEDPGLRREVESLLDTHHSHDKLLDRPAAEHLAQADDTVFLGFLEPSSKPGSLGRLGHYEVIEAVGQGGMGVVLRAFDEKLQRIVAIKALLPGFANNEAARQRFVREARAAAAITHENVINIHAVEDAGPIPYLIMQYVHGCTVQDKIDRVGVIPIKEVLRIGFQTAEGLAAAHQQVLIHRDIKPANILLENGVERIKITDFGLARAANDASLTRSGYIAGTPAYMSPEQARGEPIDYRSDLFSLGSVLFTLCAGHPPFRAENPIAVLKRVCEETPPPLREINSEVPHWLEEFIAKLQAKQPADRPQSAKEVASVLGRRLAQLQLGENVDQFTELVASSEFRRPPLRNRGRSKTWFIGGAAVVAVALFAGALISKPWSPKQVEVASQDNTGQSAEGRKPPQEAEPVVIDPKHTLEKHTKGVRSLAFSRDGSVLASGGVDRDVYLWDTKTWEARGPLGGHRAEVSGVAFSPDGSRLASVTNVPDTCSIRLWDVSTAKPAGALEPGRGGLWCVAYSPDGKTIACAGWDKWVQLFDTQSQTERLLITDVSSGMVRALSYSSDGSQIVTGGPGNTRFWHSETGKQLPIILDYKADFCPTILRGGKMVVGWSWREGIITICDIPSGQIRRSWKAHPQFIEGLAESADGRFIATIGSDGIARIWSVADGRELANMIGHKGSIHAVAFSPNGKLLVTGGADDCTIRIWELPEIYWTAQ